MKKRIFSALLVCLLVLLSTFACFAQGADIITIKNAQYDEVNGVLNFTIANTTKTVIADSMIAFEYDESEVEFGNYMGGIMTGEIKAGAEKAVKVPASIKNFDENNLPAIGLLFQYIEESGEIDATTQASIESQEIKNIFPESSTPMQAIMNFLNQTGFAALAANYKLIIMLLISFVLMYLAIVKKFEPLLLLPIAFGMMLTNLPGAGMFHEELFADGHVHWELFTATNAISVGLIDILYLGVKLGIYPCLIFLGVGAMTDFEPLIANPKSLLLGAAAQLGIFITFIGARYLGFDAAEAGSIGIIGGADGPTAIFVTSKLAPWLLGPIAVAAYSYMALVPVIQPPIMKALTTKAERQIVMKPLRKVSKTEKIIFPVAVLILCAFLLPSVVPLLGMLMLGNLFKECGVTERLSDTAQNALMNIVTIMLGVTVGATANGKEFLQIKTLLIIGLGLVAFCFSTAGGVLFGKLLYVITKGKINPLIGAAGVSAVPMAARVAQNEGRKYNPTNFLLMHAMGPNVAGVIGSAVAAGFLLAVFGGK